MDIIKRLSIKCKKWLLSKSVKSQRNRYKLNRKKNKHKNNFPNPSFKNSILWTEYNHDSPNIFSITDNTEECLIFFNKLLSDLRTKEKVNQRHIFNLSNINVLSIDAIMYLLAIIKSARGRLRWHYEFKGNFPETTSARKRLDESGFSEYVYYSREKMKSNSENITIKTGELIDSNIARKICDFVQDKFSVNKIFTKPLYDIIIELMSNTHQHAYKCNNWSLAKSWYIYIEFIHNKISFIFLDTGEGIPNTIKKRFLEKVITKEDSYFILSALKGENRTETRLDYRGEGLPSIYNHCFNNKITNLKIISGNGCCSYNSNNRSFETFENEHPLTGTLFYWEICKED